MAKHGDDTGFGFRIPDGWPKWKRRCTATSRTSKLQCRSWAVRGMRTCRRHGSGGSHNARLGLIRYLAWIIIGAPDDIPGEYARYVALAATLEMMFNHGIGSVDQKLKAAQWLLEIPPLEAYGRPRLDVRDALNPEEDTKSPHTGPVEAS